jgi:hypothetical protein
METGSTEWGKVRPEMGSPPFFSLLTLSDLLSDGSTFFGLPPKREFFLAEVEGEAAFLQMAILFCKPATTSSMPLTSASSSEFFFWDFRLWTSAVTVLSSAARLRGEGRKKEV